MPNTLEEKNWKILLKRINEGNCTPFLGSEASSGVIPLRRKIAQDLAQGHTPLNDCDDLVRVAQFVTVEMDDLKFVRDEISGRFKENLKPPDFKASDEPHGVLANLPLPLYITTNYDDFMEQALKSLTVPRNPKQKLCRWNKHIPNNPSIFEVESISDMKEAVANPVVYHFHGHIGVSESLVITEDDYLDFLVNISKEPDRIPRRIQEAVSGTSLLFMGYHITDWDFRVLLRGLDSYLKAGGLVHVSAQLAPVGEKVSTEEREKVEKHFAKYFDKRRIGVYWGTCQEFAAELRKRWEDFKK